MHNFYTLVRMTGTSCILELVELHSARQSGSTCRHAVERGVLRAVAWPIFASVLSGPLRAQLSKHLFMV